MLIKNKNKIPLASCLVTTTILHTKIGEAENKIPDVTGLVKKTDYDAKISGIEGKHFSTVYYIKFTSDILDAKIKQQN